MTKQDRRTLERLLKRGAVLTWADHDPTIWPPPKHSVAWWRFYAGGFVWCMSGPEDQHHVHLVEVVEVRERSRDSVGIVTRRDASPQYYLSTFEHALEGEQLDYYRRDFATFQEEIAREPHLRQFLDDEFRSLTDRQ